MLLFTGFLQISVLLFLAVYTSAEDTDVVIAPKTIRPGLATNIQYNTRNAPSFDTVLTEIIQNNAVKGSSTRTFRNGKYVLL